MFLRALTRRVNVSGIRTAVTAAGDGKYHPKTTSEIWLGDKGAYPIMVGIAWCVVYCVGFGTYYLWTSKDVNLRQKKSSCWRGEMALQVNEDD